MSNPTSITPEIAKFIKDNYQEKYGIISEIHRKLLQQGLKISKNPIRNFIIKNDFSYSGVSKKTRSWSDKEIEILQDKCGNIPFEEIVKKIHCQNHREKKNKRTKRSILVKCSELGLSNDISGLYYTLNDVSKRLGCSRGKILNWLKNPKIKEILKIKNLDEQGFSRIHVKDLKKFLVLYRQEIVECRPDIEWLLGLFVDPIDIHY